MRFPQRPDVERERFRADPLGIVLAVVAAVVLFLPLALPPCEHKLQNDPVFTELAAYMRVAVGFTAAQVLATLGVARCAPRRYRRGLLIASLIGLVSLVLTIWLTAVIFEPAC
jgi:hypothetical protein